MPLYLVVPDTPTSNSIRTQSSNISWSRPQHPPGGVLMMQIGCMGLKSTRSFPIVVKVTHHRQPTVLYHTRPLSSSSRPPAARQRLQQHPHLQSSIYAKRRRPEASKFSRHSISSAHTRWSHIHRHEASNPSSAYPTVSGLEGNHNKTTTPSTTVIKPHRKLHQSTAHLSQPSSTLRLDLQPLVDALKLPYAAKSIAAKVELRIE